ncbi:polysaccharide deacetylase family protein [Flavobacterium sp. ALJ2]|uniref:polysaccharide deacetylase family protein n=1 Tax=Flavobacterium sp. ALJ2 TaxID=2786960 RepID=UPI00189CF22E|nr:polysaccharide deacetylase family protein [Flavobacterium sp. ALJ2]MBF7093322.1 polysaccharide deacetylase family protein [Flavobacterium sp. ALJ2]
MNKTTYVFIGLFTVVILLITARIYSGGDEPEPVGTTKKEYQPGILLSFDDNYVEDWYNAEKRLHHLGWKATFFICKYDSLTAKQKKKLHYLKDMGHDIAAHGYNHENALKYSAAYGINKYIDNEITPLKVAMDKDGFNIRSFAYPDGARDAALDKELLKHFDIIRGTTYGMLSPESQYCYYEGNRVIYGLGIDDDYKQFNVDYYKRLMDYAKKHNKIVVFYGHKTVDNADERLETPLAALEELCKYAINNNLKFYTVDDLKNL